jgi:uncharacterized membrane protein YqhA
MLFKRVLASSRYFTLIAVVGSLVGSAALLIYEAFVIIDAVLFMREAVAWDGQRELLGFGVSLALVIAVLTLYLKVKGKH